MNTMETSRADAPLVLILGLGESGVAAASWSARQGARLRVADTRAEPGGPVSYTHLATRGST